MRKRNMVLAIAIIGVAIIILMNRFCAPPEEQSEVCRNVVQDSYHYPEEYLPGSSNYDRLIAFGVQPENIGTLNSAQEDCQDE